MALLTGSPSIDASTTDDASVARAAAACSVGRSHGTPGTVGSQSNVPAPKIHGCTAKNSACPLGIVMFRSTEFPNVPARNHRGPLWPTPAYAQVASSCGLVGVG